MKAVLIDTCIWSLALRAKQPREIIVSQHLKQLIEQDQAKIIGVIRQELLSGYSDIARYEKLRKQMSWFPNETIVDEDYETAALYSNQCRKQGIQGSSIDFLICAVAVRLNLKIFTEDKDFNQYQNCGVPIKFYLIDTAE